MKKIVEFIKRWSVVILDAIMIAALICAFVSCCLSGGIVYPVIGGAGVAVMLVAFTFQLIVETKNAAKGEADNTETGGQGDILHLPDSWRETTQSEKEGYEKSLEDMESVSEDVE